MIPKLSILILSLEERKEYLARLITNLTSQIEKALPGQVELIIEKDNGQKSIGEKRNTALEKANGDYICFIDDDDLVSSDYLKLILEAISYNTDVIGIHLLHFEDGQLRGFTYHSLDYKSWYSTQDRISGWTRYYRNPNHLNPVKRELALQVKFPLISMGEDKDYSQRLLPLLKTEKYIREPIYNYLFRAIK